MFNADHLIWQFAYYWDELDDWLPFAEDLIKKWRDQSYDEVRLNSAFEIQVACFLLADNLLPGSASKALASCLLDTMKEARDKKLKIDHLHIKPDRRGRPRNSERFLRLRELSELLKEGVPKPEAYQQIAEKYFKSVDTIRREYERLIKKQLTRGKIKKNPPVT